MPKVPTKTPRLTPTKEVSVMAWRIRSAKIRIPAKTVLKFPSRQSGKGHSSRSKKVVKHATLRWLIRIAFSRCFVKGFPRTVLVFMEVISPVQRSAALNPGMFLQASPIGLVFFFQWYTMFIYWRFVTLSIGRTMFGAGPKDPVYEKAVGWTGLVNGSTWLRPSRLSSSLTWRTGSEFERACS
jgi:hypothetical protein